MELLSQPSFSSSSSSLLVVPFVLFYLLLLLVLLQWRRRKGNNKRRLLPPGSMGWPYIGETLKLYTQNPNTFFSIRQKRYGDVFKTHVLGCPCVMVTSPEAARVVLVSQAHLFKPTYPASKERMIGPNAVFFHQGDYHSRLKKLIQASFLPSSIKGSVSEIERIVLALLPSWRDRSLINTLHEMKMVRKRNLLASVFVFCFLFFKYSASHGGIVDDDDEEESPSKALN